MKIHFTFLTLWALFVFLMQSAKAIEVEFEEDRGLPLVHLNITVKAGVVTDPLGQEGLTNFMGEMLLRGTFSKTKGQIDQALDQMGAVLAVEARVESLILRGAVLTSQLTPFLKLLEELITQSSFPDHEIRKLQSEIVSSLLEELGNDSTLASRRFTAFLFQNHPYGKPILGRIKSIENLTRPQILLHYQRLVRDSLLLVVGSGDAASQYIKEWGSAMGKSRPDLKQERVHVVPPPKNFSNRRLLIIDKPSRTQTQIHVGQVGIRLDDERFFPLYLGNYVFGGGSFSSRMMVEIRVKRGWSYGAGSYFRHGLRPRSWQMHLFPAAKDAAVALGYSLKMVESLREKGITPEEFSFAQQSLVNSSGFMYNTPKKRVENKLLEKTLNLPAGFMKSYGERLSQLQMGQVNQALKEFLKPNNLRILVLATAKELKDSLVEMSGVSPNQLQVIPYTQND